MWSGSTLHKRSGNLLGAHQKFDRVAAKFVHTLRPEHYFPNGKEILLFEGNNGPDAIKRKSPGKDEPWHYWDPTDETDTVLLDIVVNHFNGLVKALKNVDHERSAFEAAWLAHAVVDGMTPAHHYPYEQKLIELRGGAANDTRNSIKKKVMIKGDTKRQTISNNWKLWGSKGLMLSHHLFEAGVSTNSQTLRLKKAVPQNADVRHAQNIGLKAYLKEQVMEIYKLNMYERFLRTNWSPNLIRDVRSKLAPTITHTVAVIWILAVDEAS